MWAAWCTGLKNTQWQTIKISEETDVFRNFSKIAFSENWLKLFKIVRGVKLRQNRACFGHGPHGYTLHRAVHLYAMNAMNRLKIWLRKKTFFFFDLKTKHYQIPTFNCQRTSWACNYATIKCSKLMLHFYQKTSERITDALLVWFSIFLIEY